MVRLIELTTTPEPPGRFSTSKCGPGEAGATECVVCVGFPTPIGGDFELAGEAALMGLPCLAMSSTKVLAGMETVNLAVAEAKSALVKFRSERKLERLHLFIKAPSAYAMCLGHRLNGVGAVQPYDWVDGRYVATARLAFASAQATSPRAGGNAVTGWLTGGACHLVGTGPVRRRLPRYRVVVNPIYVW